MLFITAGMGGGTGTGAAPVVAQVAQGARHPDRRRGDASPSRWKAASARRSPTTASRELAKYVDSLITIPNQKLLTVLGPDDHAARCLQVRQPGAAGRGAGHRGADHAPGPDQRRLRRRAHRHGETGMAMMGTRRRQRRGPCARSPPRRRSPRRCSRTSTWRARTASWSTSPPAWTCRSASSRRSATSSSSSPPRTPPSSSAP